MTWIRTKKQSKAETSRRLDNIDEKVDKLSAKIDKVLEENRNLLKPAKKDKT